MPVAGGIIFETMTKSKQEGRRQQAKFWEFGAITSFARLMRKGGNRDDARKMLGEIYNQFTEGFDTADLKDAKALLDELGV